MTDQQSTRARWSEERIEARKRELDAETLRIAFEAGTERAFTGKYHDDKTPGVYACAGCETVLFTSDDKFDSGSGWPSYVRPADEASVTTREDISHGMVRVEVNCATCGAHLGHVFEDGPRPTGLRYCINSGVLDQRPSAGATA